MADRSPMQRWYRWHRSSLVVLGVLLLFLVLANGFSRVSKQPRDRIVAGSAYCIGSSHRELGWPLAWSRNRTETNNYLRVSVVDGFRSGPYAVRRAPEIYVRYELLVVNLLLGLVVATALTGLFELRRRRRTSAWQFTLFDLSTVTVLAAVGIGAHGHFSEPNDVIDLIEADGGYVSAQWFGPAWLGQLQPVTVTEVVFGSEPSPRIRRQVARWTDLRQLQLQGQLENPDLSFLAGLTRLEHLDLARTEIGDEQLVHLGGLKELQRLILHNREEWTNEGWTLEKRIPPKRSKGITGSGFQHLAALTRLELLDAGSTRFDDAGVAALAPLTNLRELKLSNTQITSACAPHLAKLTRLKFLGLEQTQFGPEQAEELAALKQLEAAHIGGTPLAKYVYQQCWRGHWPMPAPSHGIWFQTEIGLWKLLAEHGHSQYVTDRVTAAYAREVPFDLGHDPARLLPDLMSRDEAERFLRPQLNALLDERNPPVGTAARQAYLAAASWAMYGLDDELLEYCRRTLAPGFAGDQVVAVYICIDRPPYAQAMRPELARLALGDVGIAQVAVSALTRCGKDAVEPLLAALQHESEQVRQGVAKALGKLGVADPRIIAALEERARDDKWTSVRDAAADALQKLEPLKTSP